MRLHDLQVTAFGPFAETVTVDFDELGADGLFLLHGQTGAGKTTILDAVAFALYGTVPGARKEGKRLLSDHAPAGSVPAVTLEATIGGRRIRITRSPNTNVPRSAAPARSPRTPRRLWRGSTATARTCPGSRTSPARSSVCWG